MAGNDLGKLQLSLEAETKQFSAALQEARKHINITLGDYQKLNNMDMSKATAELNRATAAAKEHAQASGVGLKETSAGLRAISGSIRALSAVSVALNFAAMSDSFGEGTKKAAQFAAVFSGIAETIPHLVTSFGALKLAVVGWVGPIAAVLTTMAATIPTIIGAVRAIAGNLGMEGGIKIDSSLGILDTLKAMFAGGSESLGQAKNKVFGFGFEPGEVTEDFELAMMKYEASLDAEAKAIKDRIARHKKRQDELEKTFGDWDQQQYDISKIMKEGNDQFSISFYDAFMKALQEGIKAKLQDLSDQATAKRALQAMKINALAKEERLNYQARIGYVEPGYIPTETDIGASKLFNTMVTVFGTVGSKLYDMGAKIGNITTDAVKQFGDVVMSRMGEAGSIMQTAMQGFSQGGPIGAIVAVFADLATRTEHFQWAVDDLNNRVLPAVVDAFEPLAANMEVLALMSHNLVASLSKQLIPVFQALKPVFELVANIIYGFTWLLLRSIKLLGEAYNKIAGWLNIKKINLNGINEAIETLNDYPAEQVSDLGNAARGASDAINDFTGVLNAPSGFKTEWNRLNTIGFNGDDPYSYKGGTQIGVVNVYGADLGQAIVEASRQAQWGVNSSNSASPNANQTAVGLSAMAMLQARG